MSTSDQDLVETICGIWAEALGRPRVSPEENYFDLGGDSLGAIAIAAKALAKGIDLDAAAVLELQSVAAVAVVARRTTARPAAARGGTADGGIAEPLPLLPAQARFLDRGFRYPERNNVAAWLDVPTGVDEAGWLAIRTALAERHDAFATAIRPADDGWSQIFDPGIAPGYRRIERKERDDAALAELAAEAQARPVLAGGPLLNLYHVDLGGSAGRLLVVVHHLVMDALSWQLLMRDLWSGYLQAAAGGPVKLPPAGTSMRRWAREVDAYANDDRAAEVDRWLGLPWAEIADVPAPSPGRPFFTEHSTDLPPQLRAAFVERTGQTQRGMRSLLTVALARAISAWRGGGGALIDVMVHGRDGLGTRLDLSNTIGWLATDTPVVLRESEIARIDDGIASCAEQLGEPYDVEFSALRFLGQEGSDAWALRSLPQPRALLNVRAAGAGSDAATFAETGAPVGPVAVDLNPYLIRLAVDVGADRIGLRWRYHDQAAAEAHERLAESFLAALHEAVLR